MTLQSKIPEPVWEWLLYFWQCAVSTLVGVCNMVDSITRETPPMRKTSRFVCSYWVPMSEKVDDKEIHHFDNEYPFKRHWGGHDECLILAGVEIGIVFVYALVYYQVVTARRSRYPHQPKTPKPAEGQPQPTGDFRLPLFGCFDDGHYCLNGCCCPFIRAADTLSASGIAPFWVALIFLLVVYGAAQALSFWPLIVIYTASGWARGHIMAHARARLRGRLKLNPNCSSEDCCVWCLCAPCAAIQEGREIDQDTRTRVECCCYLEEDYDGVYRQEEYPTSPLVGSPVEARQLELQLRRTPSAATPTRSASEGSRRSNSEG